ncbi:MAG: MOSC domain-containing protein, partial [Planctomycetota bacterium]|nr:MOSC domain-containing protein [Planctomycetota bacterium]
PGWYCRVIKPGVVSAGSTVSLIARPFPTWSVHRLLDMLFQGRVSEEDREDLEELLPLSDAYRLDLLKE